MLEHEGQLRTWAIEQIPHRDECVEGIELPPHRLAYLDFEGEISGGRGTVRRIDQGDYRTLESSRAWFTVEMHGLEATKNLRFQRAKSPQLWVISRVDALANL
ncbi:hypothetical protein Poly24_55660 [Rosistilla carotiformis]|uniref:ATP-dependent DNA ligase n=2 Tax=Rosistilla carotiformis TaxID=2528017 RepID=A0A518K1Y5_9BACT|nr:hypothetical protein Poly24_55660 [Rosistilla carotiformis]